MKKSRIITVFSGGVLLMTASNLVVKAAGLFFKIPLTSLIGEEGMGYFSSAYTVFTWLYMLSSAGLPTAASVLISKLPVRERASGALRILRISLVLFFSVGCLFGVALFLSADSLSRLMRVENAAHAIIAVSPALLFITVSSALRGYFQGMCDLRPHSVSQTVEALGKLFFGVGLAYYAVSHGMNAADASAFAAAGVVIGVALGTAVLLLFFAILRKPRDRRDTEKPTLIAKRLMRLSLPITLSSSVMSLAGLIDSFIMTRSLHAAGLSQAETAAVWGNYSSLAMPMFNLPPVLTMPIAYALLPALTSCVTSGDKDRALSLASDAYRRTAVLATPCAVGMSVMARPILCLLFPDDVAVRGAQMLTFLAPASLLLCMLGLFNTVLQASGHERVPLYAMLTGAAVKLAATYILTPIIGKLATPVSTVLCYLAATAISLVSIAGITELAPAFRCRVLVLPIIASFAAVFLAQASEPAVGVMPAVMLCAAVYFSVVLLCDVIYKKFNQNKCFTLTKGYNKNERQNRKA